MRGWGAGQGAEAGLLLSGNTCEAGAAGGGDVCVRAEVRAACVPARLPAHPVGLCPTPYPWGPCDLQTTPLMD